MKGSEGLYNGAHVLQEERALGFLPNYTSSLRVLRGSRVFLPGASSRVVVPRTFPGPYALGARFTIPACFGGSTFAFNKAVNFSVPDTFLHADPGTLAR